MTEQKWPTGWAKGAGVSHNVIDHNTMASGSASASGLFVNDSDFQLYVGDVREQLRQLPDESVH